MATRATAAAKSPTKSIRDLLLLSQPSENNICLQMIQALCSKNIHSRCLCNELCVLAAGLGVMIVV